MFVMQILHIRWFSHRSARVLTRRGSAQRNPWTRDTSKLFATSDQARLWTHPRETKGKPIKRTKVAEEQQQNIMHHHKRPHQIGANIVQCSNARNLPLKDVWWHRMDDVKARCVAGGMRLQWRQGKVEAWPQRKHFWGDGFMHLVSLRPQPHTAGNLRLQAESQVWPQANRKKTSGCQHIWIWWPQVRVCKIANIFRTATLAPCGEGTKRWFVSDPKILYPVRRIWGPFPKSHVKIDPCKGRLQASLPEYQLQISKPVLADQQARTLRFFRTKSSF